MIDYILFGLVSLSFVFVCLSIFYLVKQRWFEDERLSKGVCSLLFGLFFLSVFLLAKSAQYCLDLFYSLDVIFYTSLVEAVCISLMAVFFLVGMIVLKEIQ